MKKRIKFTFPFPNTPIIRQTPLSSGRWGDYEFIINQPIEECDYWVVFGYLPREDSALCPRENIFFVTGEPPSIQQFNNDFLSQFGTVITCNRDIKHRNTVFDIQGLPWHVGKNYDELKSLTNKKDKDLSIIVSNKQFTEGHKARYEFAMRLKDYFGDRIDLYGRGIREVADKWDALSTYKYSIAIENSVYPDYITEKLFDCYLADTFPFYFGSPNVDKYFNKGSYALIDITDFNYSVRVIEDILNDKSHYSSSLEMIKESKDLCLEKYNIFPLIVNYIENNKLLAQESSNRISLTTEYFFDHKPKVSVLMPVYNASKYLSISVESILNQTFEDYEFIIIDDGSTDNSLEIIESYNDPRIRIIKNDENKGLIYTLNKGIKMATGEYIARMDADDRSLPDRLEKQVKFMDDNPSIGISGTYFRVMGTNTVIDRFTSPEECKVRLLSNTVLAHPTVIMRTKLLEEFNLNYNSEFKHIEDYELWVRASWVTKIANIPEVLLEYREHPNQISKVYTETQRTYANKIRIMALSSLKSVLDKEEQDLHLALVQNNTQDFQISELLEWLKNLEKINKEKKVFDEEVFKNYLSELWSGSLLSRRVFSMNILYYYFSSPLNKYMGWPLSTRLKFYVKCIINYKSK